MSQLSRFVFLTLCMSFVLLLKTAVIAETSHPNVIVFLADDQGWGDLSLHGNLNLSTPNIDSLAHEGAQFDRFFVCPVCAPTRAEFFTGRHFGRTGVRGVSEGQERLNLDEVTIGDTFLKAGYRTACFGKWHNGSQAPYDPNSRGFEEYYGFTSGHWGNYFNALMEHNRELTRGKGYITDDLTNHAIDFIKANQKQPFLCYIPYNTPHSPMQVPDKWFEKFKDAELQMRHRDPEKENRPHLLAALAMCENIDWNVGRVLQTLEELNIEDETIVVYFSDNGPNGWRWNGGMRGKKGSTDEGGVRSPCLIRWPGTIPRGRVVRPISGAIDLLPTLADLANVPLASSKPLDGKSMKDFLLGDAEIAEDRMLVNHYNKHRKGPKKGQPRISVRSQNYRLDEADRLYDLDADAGQRTNIADAHPEQVKQMQDFRDQYLKEIAHELDDDVRPFPVGYATITNLPARDGRAHGGVKRSARAPNCSYFENWTGATDDAITWDVEVGEAGTFDVIVLYTCPKADVGSTFQIQLNDAVLNGKVTEAHDPPLYGASDDRTPDRGSESYVKDFQPMTVGTIKLEKGTGTLKLQAVEVPGSTVMDVRMVRLFRKD